jgi:DNA mismatch repair protein MutL
VSSIRVLDRSVAERIAAGEVVERPASVVKELIENSLDAGARAISVEIDGAGLRLIRVADDGAGIPAEDVPLAFERFATSKISRVEDLEHVRSYGFRGEALPSIAAVAHVTLTTRTPAADEATRAVVAGGALERCGPHGAPPGTTVEVARLFFNTPARLKFLKSPAREQALVADAVQRAAMANPAVVLALKMDGREAGRWPRATAGQRVADLLGAGGAGDLIALRGAVPGGTVSGWLGRPERSRPNRMGQHLFVNRRPVQSSLLRRAVEQGYAQLLPVGRMPVFALFVDVDPATVDVNIHPRKLEVRFKDESPLFGALVRTIRGALLASPLIRVVVTQGAGSPGGTQGAHVLTPGDTYGPVPLTLEARESQGEYDSRAPHVLPLLRPLGQVLDTYIVAEGPETLYLIDQHAAHERVLYERLLTARRKGGVVAQILAVPATIELTPAQAALAIGHLDVLAAMGYAIEPFGARTVVLREVPSVSSGRAPDELLRRAIGALAEEGEGDSTLERLTIATACHSAIRSGDRLTAEAMAALLVDLAGTEDPFTCFHGRPTLIAVSRTQLEQWFLRA